MEDLEEYRKKIDAVDEELIRLLNQRAQHNQEIGKIKKQANQTVHVPDREKQIFENLSRWNQGPLSQDAIDHIFREILKAMKEVQQKILE